MRKNAYFCPDCRHLTISVDLEQGVTPMFIICNECGAKAISMMYIVQPNLLHKVSNGIIEPIIPEIYWEKPKQTDILSAAEIEHVSKGGLLMRINTEVQQKSFHAIVREIDNWSNATFGTGAQRVSGELAHLAKEVKEAQKAYDKLDTVVLDNATDSIVVKAVAELSEELIDCLMLTLDALSKLGIPPQQILTELNKKLQINKKRKWQKPNADGSVEHVR